VYRFIQKRHSPQAQHLTQLGHCYNRIKQDGCCVQVCIYVLQLYQILFFVKTPNIFIFCTNTVCAVCWSRLVFPKCLVKILGRMPVILRSLRFSSIPPCECQYGTRTRPQRFPTKSFPIHHLFISSMLYTVRCYQCPTVNHISHNVYLHTLVVTPATKQETHI